MLGENVWVGIVRGMAKYPRELASGKLFKGNVRGNVWENLLWNVRGNVRGNVLFPTQDYKSLCASVVICATLVNTQTDRQTAFNQLYY